MGSACRATAPSPPASCVLLPGVNRKQLADNAQKLEQEAADAHKAAQLLNKEGRYDVSTPCLQHFSNYTAQSCWQYVSRPF
jgi:hypothetical protein